MTLGAREEPVSVWGHALPGVEDFRAVVLRPTLPGYRPGDAVLRCVVGAEDDKARRRKAAAEAVPRQSTVTDDEENSTCCCEAWAACEGQCGHQGEYDDVGDYGNAQLIGEQRPQADEVAAGEDG